MSDLIDRSKLPEILIQLPYDVDVRTRCAYEAAKLVVQTWLMSVPAVDAVEVVRCEQCIHWNSHRYLQTGSHFCEVFSAHHRPEFYCAYGMRKDDIR